MSNTKKLIILVIGLLAASILMSAVCGISAFGFRFFNNNKAPDGSRTWTFDNGFSAFDIDTIISDVHFYQSNGRTVKIVWSGNKSLQLSVQSRNGTLVIKEKNKLPWFLRFGISFASSEVSVYLPADTYSRLNIDTDTGRVIIPSEFTFNSIDIETDTGSVDFRSAVNNTLKIHTDTGSITVVEITPETVDLKTSTASVTLTSVKASGDVKVRTDTGRITLNDIYCQNLTAESDTGRISLTNVNTADKLKVESDTGSLSLTNVISADKMKIDSDTGSVELIGCDAMEIEIETDTGSIKGTLLSGKTFDAKSGTGKVTVPADSAGGTCRIKSDTGSISIEIKEN